MSKAKQVTLSLCLRGRDEEFQVKMSHEEAEAWAKSIETGDDRDRQSLFTSREEIRFRVGDVVCIKIKK